MGGVSAFLAERSVEGLAVFLYVRASTRCIRRCGSDELSRLSMGISKRAPLALRLLSISTDSDKSRASYENCVRIVYHDNLE